MNIVISDKSLKTIKKEYKHYKILLLRLRELNIKASGDVREYIYAKMKIEELEKMLQRFKGEIQEKLNTLNKKESSLNNQGSIPCIISTNKGVLGDLSNKIFQTNKFYVGNLIEFDKKMKLSLKELKNELLKHWEVVQLEIFGSILCGIYTHQSDIDVQCIFSKFKGNEIIHQVNSKKGIDERTASHAILKFIETILTTTDIAEGVSFIGARKPIVSYVDRKTKMKIDISLGEINYSSLTNNEQFHSLAVKKKLFSHNRKKEGLFIGEFIKIDKKLRHLVLFIKNFSKINKLTGIAGNSLNSYTLYLMVIFFLQQGYQKKKKSTEFDTTPFHPVLPVFAARIAKDNHEKFYFVNEYSYESPSFKESKSKETLGNLLLKFFYYYSIEFSYARDCASVRLGKTIRKQDSYIKKGTQRNTALYFAIEDPFALFENTARTIQTKKFLTRIRSVFYSAYHELFNQLFISKYVNLSKVLCKQNTKPFIKKF